MTKIWHMTSKNFRSFCSVKKKKNSNIPDINSNINFYKTCEEVRMTASQRVRKKNELPLKMAE